MTLVSVMLPLRTARRTPYAKILLLLHRSLPIVSFLFSATIMTFYGGLVIETLYQSVQNDLKPM